VIILKTAVRITTAPIKKSCYRNKLFQYYYHQLGARSNLSVFWYTEY